MTAAPRQLILDLAHRQALGAEDFLVSRSNAAAVELIDRWPDWPHPASLVIGTQGSGKTHLAHVWQLRSSAGLIAASGSDGHRRGCVGRWQRPSCGGHRPGNCGGTGALSLAQ